jgi:putative transposase
LIFDHQMPTMPSNILDRQFEAARPNQKWIADFTYIRTAEGWLCVSAVTDRSRAGWWVGR